MVSLLRTSRVEPRDAPRAELGSLRAAVLGADDGIVSTASLVLGVGASSASSATFAAGVAGLVAGALSMAAGEWVSVNSQRDAQQSMLERERNELLTDPEGEVAELTAILESRGVSHDTAALAADEMMAKDALGAHAAEELSLSDLTMARPARAAATSAISFACGAAVPVAAIAIVDRSTELLVVTLASLLALGILGLLGAAASRSSVSRSILRVIAGGAAAMAVTFAVGTLSVVIGI